MPIDPRSESDIFVRFFWPIGQICPIHPVIKPADLLRRLRGMARHRGIRFEVQEGGNHTKVWFGDRQTVIGRHARDLKTRKLLATVKQLGLTKSDLED